MLARQRNDPLDAAPEQESRDAGIQRRMRVRSKKLLLPPLKIVVMSATLDVDTFKRFFSSAEMITIPGRTYPVQIVYTMDAQEDYIDSALSACLQIHSEAHDEGDILVFLPGQEEIEDLASLLRKHIKDDEENERAMTAGDIVQSIKGIGTNIHTGTSSSIVNGVLICVLYAALPSEAQLLAFKPKPEGCTRKIILATNIAETSVTLDGIRFVVDCGKHKTRDFSNTTGMESLVVSDISKAQAAQRAGRAGRVSAGLCFRLYTENGFDAMSETTVPEILRVNLAQVVLQLKGMGVHDPRNFEFLTVPNSQSLLKAFELLYALTAVDTEMNLTSHGKQLAKIPLDPIFAHLLLQSPKYGCTSEMLTAVAMLSAENVFYRPGGGDADGGISARAAAAHKRFTSYEGDLPTLLNVYQSWKREALYLPSHTKKTQRHELKRTHNGNKIIHGEWCTRNFISGRSLVRANDVRNQLSEICGKISERNGLGMDIQLSCGTDMELFLKCACAGLFLQVATRVTSTVEIKNYRGRSGTVGSSRGRYKTKIGSVEVSIHPTSTMFGRNPAPKCVVYTEMLQTKKTYIQGVTQVREDWLVEVAPHFFKPS
jgi:HrpA-like RNA helicase